MKGKKCKAYHAPFDLLLPAFGEETDEEVITVVQPDISVICDTEKLTYRGGAGSISAGRDNPMQRAAGTEG